MINTFKRFELKYLLTPAQYEIIQETIQDYLEFDPYCPLDSHYYVHTIYYDTCDDQVIKRSLEKPYYKEKLRLRAYKVPESDEEDVFLELKKKIGGVVCKRRALMSYAQAKTFIETGMAPQANSYLDRQVFSEIRSFMKRYDLVKEVQIGYKRLAYYDTHKSDLRLSFDEDVATTNDVILEKGYRIMEIKCSGALPLWLTELLSENKIYKSSFSKYGAAYRRARKIC
jgi:hypothetical protein